ncbi:MULTISPECIES: hypothetical protein [Chelativorans]|jgi:hypothetical protein|uniref:hypothetical protein n=1 Tax=Chelativorans TaxID=449972 RepID=UPI00003A3216|nr:MULTISPECIES: hypothetical protein [Chelativorans]
MALTREEAGQRGKTDDNRDVVEGRFVELDEDISIAGLLAGRAYQTVRRPKVA